MIIALGYDYAGAFTNDDQLVEEVTKVGNSTGENIWRMPISKEARNVIKS